MDKDWRRIETWMRGEDPDFIPECVGPLAAYPATMPLTIRDRTFAGLSEKVAGLFHIPSPERPNAMAETHVELAEGFANIWMAEGRENLRMYRETTIAMTMGLACPMPLMYSAGERLIELDNGLRVGLAAWIGACGRVLPRKLDEVRSRARSLKKKVKPILSVPETDSSSAVKKFLEDLTVAASTDKAA